MTFRPDRALANSALEPEGDVVAPVASWESVIANSPLPHALRRTIFVNNFSNTLII